MDSGGQELSLLDQEILERAAGILDVPVGNLRKTLQALAESSPVSSEGDEGSFGSEETQNASIPQYAWPAGLQGSSSGNQMEELGFEVTDDWSPQALSGQTGPYSYLEHDVPQEWTMASGNDQLDSSAPFDTLSEAGYVLIPNPQHSFLENTAARPPISYSPDLRTSAAACATDSLHDSGYLSTAETAGLGFSGITGIEPSFWQNGSTLQGPGNATAVNSTTMVGDSFLDVDIISRSIEDTSTTSQIGRMQSSEVPHTWNLMPHSGPQQMDPFLVETPTTQIGKRHDYTSRKLNRRRLQAFARNVGSGQQKRRPFQTHQDRVQTGRTRRVGACIRCRMQRVRCSDDQGICLTCQKVKNLRIPCLRHKLTESCLFRTGGAPGYGRTLRWSNMQMDEISHWNSSTVKTIFLTQYLCDRPLRVQVKEFVPFDGDVLEREWVDQQTAMKKRSMVPRYAVANMKATSIVIQQYVDRSVESLIKCHLSNSGPLIFQTYLLALKLSGSSETDEEERTFLRNVLRLWVAIRMTSPSMYIQGTETLGMNPEQDTSSPDYGKFPISPVMTAQVQLILYCTVLLPLRKEVLRHLNTFMTESEPRKWFTIYVGLFILLHSCALVTKGAYNWARKRGDKNRYANKPLIEDLHMGAKVFLGHWHSCTKGTLLFATSTEAEELKRAMNLTQEQRTFLESTTSEIYANRAEIGKARLGHYEHDLFFLSQLYDDEWVPVHTSF